MEIEINGIKYKKIEKQQSSNKSNSMSAALMMVALFSNFSGSRPITRPDVILEQEYTLILEKKSKLSRNDREWVVRQFKLQYKKLKSDVM